MLILSLNKLSMCWMFAKVQHDYVTMVTGASPPASHRSLASFRVNFISHYHSSNFDHRFHASFQIKLYSSLPQQWFHPPLSHQLSDKTVFLPRAAPISHTTLTINLNSFYCRSSEFSLCSRRRPFVFSLSLHRRFIPRAALYFPKATSAKYSSHPWGRGLSYLNC